MTRPIENGSDKDTAALETTLASLHDAGVTLAFRPGIDQKFAIIDEKIVWYGSINLLSFGSSEESIMRLESTNIAYELMKTIEQSHREYANQVSQNSLRHQ